MRKHALLLALLASFLTSCKKMDLDSVLDDQTLGTALAIPIGTATVTLSDLYKQFDTLITPQIGDDNTIFIYWEQPISVDEFNFKDFTKGEKYEGELGLNKDDTLKNLLENLPEGSRLTLPEGKFVLEDTVKYSFSFNEQDPTKTYFIDSVLFRNATLNFGIDMTDIDLDENTYIEAEICFPNLATGRELKFGAIVTTEHVKVERATGYFRAEFEREGNNDVDMYITFKIVSDGTKTISKNTAINYNVEFDGIDFDIVHGYIYEQAPICSNHTKVEFPESEQLSDFLNNNTVSLYNPELSISLTTNLGIDAYLDINGIYAMTNNAITGESLFNGKKSDTKKINTPEEPYDTETFTLTLNREYGEINKLFQKMPDSLILDWDIRMGETSNETQSNFVVNPVQVDAKFMVRIPIWFDKGTTIHHNDTIDADLTSINGEWADYVNISQFNIYLDFENTLPIQAIAKISFLDSLGEELMPQQDSIEIPCPPVDTLGRSLEPASKESTLEFKGENIANIIKTKKIAISYTINGHDAESSINFHASDGLKVRVSAYANCSTEISNLTK